MDASVLIIGEDADSLAALVREGAPSIPVATAADADDALANYNDQRILSGRRRMSSGSFQKRLLSNGCNQPGQV